MVKAVVGLNWGDEGKGRMIDYFASTADCVIRYQGGDNAGHTVVNEYGKFAFHNIPSGICYPNVLNIIAAGSVINPKSFVNELNDLKDKGLDINNIAISDRATLILPFHMIREGLEEARMKDKKYGSTMSGIAPVYGDKYTKKGIMVGELLDKEELKKQLKAVVEYQNLIIQGMYKGEPVKFEEIYAELLEYIDIIKPYIKNVTPIISKMIKEDKNIIVEAQLGALRDISHGIYPYTTSSSTLAGYACASVPIPPNSIEEVIGITKAYSTCVGAGPFVTELNNDLGDSIREKAKEYGAKTGRPRRIGYFDGVATTYGCQLQGATSMVITCLDVLSGYDDLKICTGYEINGKITKDFPLNYELNNTKPIYEDVDGWIEDISSVRKYEDLPVNARKYVEKVESITGVPVKFISVGPNREELIVR